MIQAKPRKGRQKLAQPFQRWDNDTHQFHPSPARGKRRRYKTPSTMNRGAGAGVRSRESANKGRQISQAELLLTFSPCDVHWRYT